MPEISPVHNQIEYSVSEIAGAIKRVVEDAFGYVRLRGELSGYRGPHSSGHCYFNLKDEKACVNAVMWKGNFQKLAFKPEEGLEVIAVGKITTYPGKSNYQIVVDHMEPAGVGALMALLEKRKVMLAAEGLFAAERKQLLPFLPEVIGVVTSPTGAVIRDILHRISDRFPRRVIVWPVAVQGEAAAGQIAAAIRGFNSLPDDMRPDVLIVARGGGSIEDLWAFNEEMVVRAAAESDIPLISAVGHETDTTLIDYVADVRAPTPTAAAEMAVPVREEWRLTLLEHHQRLGRSVTRQLSQREEALTARSRLLPRLLSVTENATQKLDEWGERLHRALPKLVQLKQAGLMSGLRLPLIFTQSLERKQAQVERYRLQSHTLLLGVKRHGQDLAKAAEQLDRAFLRRVNDHQRHVAEQARVLANLDYKRVLERGYALVRDEQGKVVSSAAELNSGQTVNIQFKDGNKQAKV